MLKSGALNFLCTYRNQKKDGMPDQTCLCRGPKTGCKSGCRVFLRFAGLLLLGFFSLSIWLPATGFPLLTLSLCHIAVGVGELLFNVSFSHVFAAPPYFFFLYLAIDLRVRSHMYRMRTVETHYTAIFGASIWKCQTALLSLQYHMLETSQATTVH